jgi:YfiH family protein
MIRQQQGGVVFYRFQSLSACRVVLHAVFTRIGGTSGKPFHSLNVGQLVGDEPAAVQANHALMMRTLGIHSGQLVTARQVHGAEVAVVGTSHRGTVLPATDSLISQACGVALLLRFADCLPLMLYDPLRQAIGLAHVGWRGCLAGVVGNTVVAMQRAFSSDPRDLVAGLGPAIGPCCYQVGPDLITGVRETCGSLEAFLLTQPDGSVHFDLPSAVRSQLHQAGVQKIEDSALCTSCHTDEFFSHRGERGRTGRFAAVLALRE